MAYSQKEIDSKFNLIVSEISEGGKLRHILKGLKISSNTFYKWIESDKEKEKQYARACEDRADLKFESIESDYMESPQRDPETGKIDSAWVNLQRLKIDAKKWELSKLMPKKYGDKQETTHIFENPIFKGIDLDVSENNGSD